MDIVRVLKYIGYTDQSDFEVWDDGTGPYIKEWTHIDVQPDGATLSTQETAMFAELVLAEIPNAKTQASGEIDNSAGNARSRYITDIVGQEMTYQDKAEEATDYVAAGYPVSLTSYPYIQAEVTATGKTSTQAADDILSAKSAWIALSSQIEQIRIGGKVNVVAATDTDGVTIAKNTAITALNAI